jgi:pimeloyl-ACP methyl ester carboxylesterase
MKRLLTIVFALFMLQSLSGQDISGQWNGQIEIQGMKLRIILHVEKDGENWTATMDSPDQGANGIPVDEITLAENQLNFKIASLLFEYSGAWSDDQIEGSFSQGGTTLPLNFSREELEAPVVNRPQNPERPLPYYEEEVEYPNPDGGHTLAGTLTLPDSTGSYPVVILISGSGPQNRDEELLGHKPFLVLSDHLTRQGIGVLRFDDRGVGKSTGDHSIATSEDFASDVVAGIEYLKTRTDVMPDKIGLAGHSEGGLIAPLAYLQAGDDISFMVLIAGPGVSGMDVIVLQQELIGKAEGMAEDAIKNDNETTLMMFQMMKEEEDREVLREKLLPIIIENILATDSTIKEPEAVAESALNRFLSPWFEYFLDYDPATALEQVDCPVLAINGEKDLQVDPKQNLPVIEKALRKGGNTDVTIVEMKGLNHLFQETETGKPSEYATIETTFSTEALKVISDWILSKVVG